jgi:hypothetical protein
MIRFDSYISKPGQSFEASPTGTLTGTLEGPSDSHLKVNRLEGKKEKGKKEKKISR